MTIEEIIRSPDYQAWMSGRQPRPTLHAERLLATLERINSHLSPDNGGVAVEIEHDRLDKVRQDL
jgi:hypothetical protein